MPAIAEAFGVARVATDLAPSYNVAPGHYLVVVNDQDGRQLVQFRWGLIPSWAKDPSIGNRMINARAETVAQKPSFRSAFRRRRCLIIADGFYEWQQAGPRKRPVYVHLASGRPFGFAGLYETWVSPSGERIGTCTIITTGPNDFMRPIHHRMPVIIPRDQEAVWLDPDCGDEARLLGLLRPYAEEAMEAHEVSTTVNSPVNDSPDLIEPLPPPGRRPPGDRW